MASEASWQTSSAGAGRDSFSDDQPMDQRTVESLLRRLVERVEESERRYGEALDELHARLDQLSQTTEAAARETSLPEDADTFDRLHSQVSKLARRLDQDTSNSLEDFERLGKALSGGLRHDLEETSEPFGHEPEPSPFAQAAMGGKTPEPMPASGYPDFGYAAPEAESFPSSRPFEPDFAGLDKRLVDMAQRLEQSIGAAMPTSAIDALNQRLEEIGGQLAQALEKAPTRAALEHVERQISDMGQQLGRAEEQLGKVSGVEAHLLSLIARLDEKPAATLAPAQMDEIASKAANEAARLVAGQAKQNSERLDAMHRDLKSMSDKSRESGDRLVSTLEAVHDSLKQLVQQVERGAAFPPRPRPSFSERTRQAEAKQPAPQFKMPTPQQRPPQPDVAPAAPAAKTTEASQDPAAYQGAARERLRDRLGAAIPDFQDGETPPPFGRAKRSPRGENAVDLDTGPGPSEGLDAAPDDLVAAARRAAQAAAARAEERGGRRPSSYLPGSAPSGEQPGRRKRSLLIISAAVLLALSAILLYGRLSSKPAATPAPAEQTSPAPTGDTGGTTTPQGGETAPADTLEKQGSWQPLPDTGADPSDSADSAPTTGFTDMAKSSPAESSPEEASPAQPSSHVPAMPASELSPEPQLAALHPNGEAALPPGVIFSVEEPGATPDDTATATQAPSLAMPVNLPLPPAGLGPLPLRQAAARGDAAAQYIIGVHYADGVGTKADLKAAAKWFERAASAGLAPAQYRLAAMYERGIGVEQDLGQARTWYAAAAEKGNIKAMHNLAVSVSGRDGSAPDYALAAKWYAEAASYDLPDSQFNLGVLAEHGLGIKKNLAEAYKWFSLAAAHGDAEATKRREVIRVQLAPSTLAKADAELKAWKAKPAIADANEVADNPAWVATAPATNAVPLVARAQTLLNKLGYDVGAPDGLVGSRTRTAVKLFQQRNGLAETGEITIPLVTQLEHLSS